MLPFASIAMSRAASVSWPPQPTAHCTLPLAPPLSGASSGSGLVSTGFFTAGCAPIVGAALPVLSPVLALVTELVFCVSSCWLQAASEPRIAAIDRRRMRSRCHAYTRLVDGDFVGTARASVLSDVDRRVGCAHEPQPSARCNSGARRVSLWM